MHEINNGYNRRKCPGRRDRIFVLSRQVLSNILDDSNNDITICVLLREYKQVLIVLAFQPELTKPERTFLDTLVALEWEQQAILSANVALEQIPRDNC